ncbi:uncharacterized protein [Nicotiana tomentosiformis]|uniref:uncharacterized protein n=1 Tax=Nicotiana tomentosiformis TaxID=4098 RepID=UPI00388C8573
MTDDELKRLEIFGRLQPLSFSGATSEDAQDFLDKCQRTLHTTSILETSGVSFTTFQFTRDAFIWWEAYERSKPVGAAPLSWHEFSVLFLEKFVPQTRREELRRQFKQLCQDVLSVTQYEMKFLELPRQVVWLVLTERESIRRFIDGLHHHVRFVMTRESVFGARFDEVVDIARRLEMVYSQEREDSEAKRHHGSGGFNGVPSGGQFSHIRGHPYRTA